MSSQFNIGMSEGRNSSRVLKPPGGGHSQIFGFSNEDDAPKKVHQKTEISSCFMQESNEMKTTKSTEVIEEVEKHDEVKNGVVENGKSEETNENGKLEQNGENGEKKDETKTDSTPQRKRVPPGGYSSGFW